MKDKKLTINDIAQLTNTSKTTVSFYLNGKFDKMSNETRERIRDVIAEYDYTPNLVARSLNAKRVKLIGVIIGDITNVFANQIVKGIEEVARSKGYHLIIGNSNYDFETEKSYVERMLAMGVDGFIVQPTRFFHPLIDLIKRNNKSLVFIDSQTEMHHNYWVNSNNYETVYQATQSLIDKGYTDYLAITADPSVLSVRKERISGFRDALSAQGITPDIEIVDGDISIDTLYNSITESIKLNRKTLIFVANCWLLPLVYKAIKPYKDLIPNTIGLLGIDNLEWSEISSPSVTTIVQPAYEEGVMASKILIDAIEGLSEMKTDQTLECSINWLESTDLS